MPPEPAPAAASTTSMAAMSTSHFNREPRRLRLRAMPDITGKATPLAHEHPEIHEPERLCQRRAGGRRVVPRRALVRGRVAGHESGARTGPNRAPAAPRCLRPASALAGALPRTTTHG